MFFDLLGASIIELWQRFDFSFHSFLALVYAWKNYSSQNSKIWIVADQKLMDFSADPVSATFCWVSRHRIRWILRAWHYLFCDVPFISLFDSDSEFILAHEHLSQQPLWAVHMSTFITNNKKISNCQHWLSSCYGMYTLPG